MQGFLYFQVSLVVYPDEVPVLYERLLPDSQVTFPLASRGWRKRRPKRLCGS